LPVATLSSHDKVAAAGDVLLRCFKNVQQTRRIFRSVLMSSPALRTMLMIATPEALGVDATR